MVVSSNTTKSTRCQSAWPLPSAIVAARVAVSELTVIHQVIAGLRPFITVQSYSRPQRRMRHSYSSRDYFELAV